MGHERAAGRMITGAALLNAYTPLKPTSKSIFVRQTAGFADQIKTQIFTFTTMGHIAKIFWQAWKPVFASYE